MQDNKPSTTAQIVAFLRAVLSTPVGGEALSDPYARSFLRAPFSQLFEATQGVLSPLVYRAMILTTGAAGNICARTQYFDEKMRQALEGGCTQVVILGAGYDTRALRLASPKVRFFEVDHPATQADKRARLSSLGLPSPTFVTVDFTRDDLTQKLEEAGFSRSHKAFFLWEGVTMYLTEPEVRATLRAVKALAAPESQLSFDVNTGEAFHPAHHFRTRLRSAAVSWLGEPWKLWMTQQNIPQFLAEEGWRCLEMLGPKELTARYLPERAPYSVPPNKFVVLAGA